MVSFLLPSIDMLKDYTLMGEYSYFTEEIKRTRYKVEAMYDHDMKGNGGIICEFIWQDKIMLSVDFTLSKCLSEEGQKIMINANTPEERKFILKTQLTYEGRFIEAVSFGLEYAYDIYLEEYPKEKQRGGRLEIQSILTNLRSYSPDIAMVSARCLWKILEFVPQEEIYFSTTLNKYIFPKTKKPIPISLGRDFIINEFKQGVYREKEFKKRLEWYEEDLIEYNNRTEENYKPITSLEMIQKYSKRQEELQKL